MNEPILVESLNTTSTAKIIVSRSMSWFALVYCQDGTMNESEYLQLVERLNSLAKISFYMLVLMNINGKFVFFLNIEYNISLKQNIVYKDLKEVFSVIRSNLLVYVRSKFFTNCSVLPKDLVCDISTSKKAINFLMTWKKK